MMKCRIFSSSFLFACSASCRTPSRFVVVVVVATVAVCRTENPSRTVTHVPKKRREKERKNERAEK
jgi:hypothetical protein